jgi:lysozyme
MIFSEAGYALLRQLEPKVPNAPDLEAYQDGGGVWTIGYGHTGPEVKQGLVWSASQGEWALQGDVARTAAQLETGIAAGLLDNEFSALVCLAYNVGVSLLLSSRYTAGGTLAAVNAGQLGSIQQHIESWNKAKDRDGVLRVVPGLVGRRAAEVALWWLRDSNPPPDFCRIRDNAVHAYLNPQLPLV